MQHLRELSADPQATAAQRAADERAAEAHGSAIQKHAQLAAHALAEATAVSELHSLSGPELAGAAGTSPTGVDEQSTCTLTYSDGKIAALYAGLRVHSTNTATIVGTRGSDGISGTIGDDVIVARGGNDTIHPGDGNDRIGFDQKLGPIALPTTILGGAGDDRIDGSAGPDRPSG